MAKKPYTGQDIVRAWLRSAISNENNEFRRIMNRHLDRTAMLVHDGADSVYLQTRGVPEEKVYGISQSALNSCFFNSQMNDASARFIAQAHTILARGIKLEKQLQDSKNNAGPSVVMDPVFYGVISDYSKQRKETIDAYMLAQAEAGSQLPESEIYAKAKKSVSPMSGDCYEEYLIAQGFKGRKLEQAKYFIDIMGKQYNEARITDYLDTYTMFHYYLFRHSINERFNKYVRDNYPDMRDKYIMFERIAQEEIKKFSHIAPCEANGFFDRTKASFSPRKMNTRRASEIVTATIDGAYDDIYDSLRAQLQEDINASCPEGYTIKVDKLIMDERSKHSGGQEIVTTINVSVSDTRTSLQEKPETPYKVVPTVDDKGKMSKEVPGQMTLF